MASIQEPHGITPSPEIVPALTLMVVEPPIEPMHAAASHKAFMSTRTPQLNGKKVSDKAKEWLREMEKAFRIVEVSELLLVRFETYMLIGDAKNWWRTLLEIKYSAEESTWNEFVQQFLQAYTPEVVKERKLQEFLELG